MFQASLLYIVFYLGLVILLAIPVGRYMKKVYCDEPCGLDRILAPVERFLYWVCGIDKSVTMDWRNYVLAMLYFNFVAIIAVYLLQRCQGLLPLNQIGAPGLAADLAFNNAVSISSNTGWQAYIGEQTMSYGSQLLTVTVQNIVSGATGLALAVAFIRGLVSNEVAELGNFWVDLVRSVLYVILPLCLILSIILMGCGVIQNLNAYQAVPSVQDHNVTQIIPMGPVASFVASRQVSGSGIGFFSANAAHPFENPNQISNGCLLIAMLLLPAALFYTFGLMARDLRQSWMLLITMSLVLALSTLWVIYAEHNANADIVQLGLSSTDNLEGKEVRFGVIGSSAWAAATTATSNGSMNSMHDSYMPISLGIMLTLMHLGAIIFGGVGCGLSGMILIVLISVFLAGLMVGRTPEYLGKKIYPRDMKLICLIVMVLPLLSMVITAIASVKPDIVQTLNNPGPHGFTEILYAFISMRNNNGSMLAGIDADNWFYNLLGGICMLVGRYWVAIPSLAIAGSFAQKKILPATVGTLGTHNAIFAIYMCMVIFVLGILSFIPTLALGPIVESLHVWGNSSVS